MRIFVKARISATIQPEYDAGSEPAEELRPWKRPGAVGRDCAPHRGNWLRVFATVALLLGIFAAGCLFLALLSAPLGVVVWVSVARDLAEIRAGRMEPNGEKETRDARACALVAVFVPLIGWSLWAALFLAAHLFAP